MNGFLWALFGICALSIFVFGILIIRQISIASELTRHGAVISILALFWCSILVLGSGILLFFALSL